VEILEILTAENPSRPDLPLILESNNVELDIDASLHPEIVGQIERLKSGLFRVSANKTDHPYRKNFTVAHELGHWFRHRDLLGTGTDDSKAYRAENIGKFYNTAIGPKGEAEANSFAAALLMPKKLVIEHHGPNFRDYAPNTAFQRLYHYFKVSPSAMRWRLNNLGLQHD